MSSKFTPNPTLFRVKRYLSNGTKAGEKMAFVNVNKIGLKLKNGSVALTKEKELTSHEISLFTEDEKKEYLIVKENVRQKSNT